MKELIEVKQVLQQIQSTKAQHEVITKQRTTQSEEATIQITTLASENCNLTKDMLRVDKDLVQKKLKDIEWMELVLAKTPTKSLYQLQFSVVQ